MDARTVFVLCMSVLSASLLPYSLQCLHSYRDVNVPYTVTELLSVETVRSQIECAIYCALHFCVSFSFDTQTKACSTSRNESYSETSQLTRQFGSYIRITTDPLDCGDICCTDCSGVYQITPVPGTSFDVFCDMDTIGGPWTFIQRRFDGSVDFYRDWNDYKLGFGNTSGEYWLGLDYMYSLLSLGQMLSILIEGWDGSTGYASYQTFVIDTELQKYQLTLGGFNGNVVDQFTNHHGYYFSTKDIDNDASTRDCARFGRGGWWYRNCYMVNLNGLYTPDKGLNVSKSMNWNFFDPNRRQPPLKKSTMMVKRKNMG